MDKVFICFWDAGTYGKDQYEKHDISFFTEDKGYSPEEIQKINNLEVGQSLIILEEHAITRYK